MDGDTNSVMPHGIAMTDGGAAHGEATHDASAHANVMLWSDMDPAPGQDVIIPHGMTVILDVDTPPLGTLAIQGTLKVAEGAEVTLTADNVLVFGALEVGSEGAPFTGDFEIVLTGEASDPDVVLADWADDPDAGHHGGHNAGHDAGHETGHDTGHGDHNDHMTTPLDNKALIVAPGGRLELHGEDAQSWTQLDGTAGPGATSIDVLDATGWQVGDTITIAPTGLDAFEVEDRVITGIDGNTITFDDPLAYRHFGAQQDLGDGKLLDMRAEVANLSRNITVRGEEDPDMQVLETNSAHEDNGARVGYGGHVIVLDNTEVKIDGAEFTELGISGEIGRYALHFHHSGDMEGSYIQDTSVHHTLQRGIVVHQTDNLLVKDTVVYDTMSHGIYLEDGVETGNRFDGNLVMLPRSSHNDFRVDEVGINLTVRDSGEKASGFWITNVENEFEGNHVVGVPTGQGFWFVQPDVDTSHVDRSDPRKHDNVLLQFENNTAHTIMADEAIGFLFGYSPIWTGVGLDIQLNLGEEGADIVGFTAWQVANMAIASIKEDVDFIEPVIADVRKFVHTQFPETLTTVKDGVFVVKSDNMPEDIDLYEHYLTKTFEGPQLVHSAAEIVFEGLNLIGAEHLHSAVARVSDAENLSFVANADGEGQISLLDLAQDYRHDQPEALLRGEAFFGFGGNDTARGDEQDNVLVGGDGNDTFGGYDGADILVGGAGDDVLARQLVGGQTRNNGIDVYMGGEGDDLIDLGKKSSDEGGIVVFQKGDGNDLITGFDGKGPVQDKVYLIGYSVAELDTDGDGDFDNADLRARRRDEDFGRFEEDKTIDLGDGSSLAFRGSSHKDDLDVSDFVLIPNAGSATGRIAQALALDAAPGTFAEATGEPDPWIRGTSEGDWISGDGGTDQIDAGEGHDTLAGRDGDDTLAGGEGDDTVIGGNGADHLAGDEGGDILNAGFGNDTLEGGSGGDTLYGGNDNDLLYGGRGADFLNGNNADDVLYGGLGDDDVFGAGGEDTVFGGEGDDTVNGGNRDDTVFGNQGDDLVLGGAGSDVLFGGADADDLRGSLGFDTLFGGAGEDKLNGGEGQDSLFGGLNDDLLVGFTGNDVLNGGGGDDRLSGGTGADAFLFSEANFGNDTILDFTTADRIDLSGLGVGFEDLDITESANSTVITLDAGTIRLFNVDETTITEDDFLFAQV